MLATVSAADLYVDCRSGADANTGRTPSLAWRSLDKANQANLAPGDTLRFLGGCVWDGQLRITRSGTAAQPIVVTSYGNGRPRIDAGATQAEDALLIRNAQHLRVENLELTHSGPATRARRGVHILLDNFGTASNVTIRGLFIHDVNGTNQKKDNGGIIFRTLGDRTPSRFDGLTIERNILWKVDRSAIAAQSYHWRRTAWFPSLHVVIRDNYAEDIGGDGIVPWATDGALVEHNVVKDCNRRAATYNAGIWPWSTDNSVFRLNRASFTRTAMDGQGFDSDFNSRNTLFEYNLSHDNEGGFMLICTPGKRDPAENVGNTGTVVRYNISRNDRERIFHLSAAEDTLVHDNLILVGPGLEVQMLITTDWEGWGHDALFRNNRFLSEGTSRYGHQVSRSKDGRYGLGTGWGPATGIRFAGNTYEGTHVGRPEDPAAKINSKAAPPAMDWPGPQFHPAQPGTFDIWINAHRAWMTRLFEQQFGRKPS